MLTSSKKYAIIYERRLDTFNFMHLYKKYSYEKRTAKTISKFNSKLQSKKAVTEYLVKDENTHTRHW